MSRKKRDGFDEIFDGLMGTMGRQMLMKSSEKSRATPDEIRTSSFTLSLRLDDSGIYLDVTEMVREERFARKR